MKITGLLILILLGLAGCFSANNVTESPVDLRSYRRIYVESSRNDSNHLDELLAHELQRLGYEASAGVRTMMPTNTQLVLSYESQWTWDFQTYLIQLDVTMRDVSTEKNMGKGMVFHSGVVHKSPEKMVAELLAPYFGPKRAKK